MFLRSLSILLAAISVARSLSTYQQSIPNGGSVLHPCKPNHRWMGVGHEAAGGGGVRNPFGTAFQNSNHNWLAICNDDSDGDGRTNGQELGDPNCVWRVGDIPKSVSGITHPGVCEPMDAPRCDGLNDWVDCSYEEFDCAVLNETETRGHTITFPRVNVPAQETTLMCMPFIVPDDKAYHLVAVTPDIDNRQVVHHVMILGCDVNSMNMSQKAPVECGVMPASCQSSILGWTVGISGMCNDPNIGYAFGANGFNGVIVQIHYNNPMLRDDYWDASGITLHYTHVLRKYDAQLLVSSQNYINIPPGQSSVPVMTRCSSGCTLSMLSEPIYITTAFHHMHYLGISAKTEHFRDNKKIGEIAPDPYFSYDSPAQHDYDPPITVLPGDELITTCEYKSTSRTTLTSGGDATNDEMCNLFAIYYPNITRYSASISCGQYKSVDTCRVFNQEFFGPVDGCQSPTSYFNTADPEIKRFMDEIVGACPFNQCTKKCSEVIQQVKEGNCFRGEFGDMMIFVIEFFPGGKRFTDAMKTCDRTNASTPVRISMLSTLAMVALNMIF